MYEVILPVMLHPMGFNVGQHVNFELIEGTVELVRPDCLCVEVATQHNGVKRSVKVTARRYIPYRTAKGVEYR